MKKYAFMKNSFLFLLVLIALLPLENAAQDVEIREPSFGFNVMYPAVSMTKKDLASAVHVSDLDPKFPASWIREYLRVEVTTFEKGKKRMTTGHQEKLNREQRDALAKADPDRDISISVRYIPENTLVDNPPQTLEFTCSVDPETDASYPEGKTGLIAYFRQKVIQHLPEGLISGYDLAAYTFSIGEEGQVLDPAIFNTSGDDQMDALVLEVIRNMPKWTPACHADGTRDRQKFVFTIGNLENCIVPLLNIRC